ncbi:MAG TPA: transglycosylase SLT domain-containing protein [Gemmatimonas sp.]|nr:transglycosylase SLT domain-containing protein [Gemmatimonas sp.]
MPKVGIDSVTITEELTRTAIGVFGDSAGLLGGFKSSELAEPEFDLDVRSYETHARVAHYIALFSGSAREHFVARLSRGTRYEPMIRAKLRAGGLPEDLTYLALVESGYDPHAYSRAAAVGMWQFMSSTARGVGMRVDWWVDERRDPARSTDGAIRFLKELQRQFGGSLYLAAAAYNGGPGRVARGLTRFADQMEGSEGDDRFFALAEQDYLRAETKDYVPQLIAAALVAKTPTRHGLAVVPVAPYAYDSIRVDPGTSMAAIAAASSSTIAELRELNPSILRGVTPPDVMYYVKLPLGRGTAAEGALASLPASARTGYTSRTVSGSKSTVDAFAREAGVSAKALTAFNPTIKKSKSGSLTAGQTLRIPNDDALAFARDVPNPSIEIYGGSTRSTLAKAGVHVVRRGETLGGIARRYGLSVTRLKSLNRMKGTKVNAGQTLRVATSAKAKAKAPSKAGSKSSAGKSTSAKKSTAKKGPAKKKTSTAKKPATSRSTMKTKAKPPT